VARLCDPARVERLAAPDGLWVAFVTFAWSRRPDLHPTLSAGSYGTIRSGQQSATQAVTAITGLIDDLLKQAAK
jgi:hypothetical protein